MDPDNRIISLDADFDVLAKLFSGQTTSNKKDVRAIHRNSYFKSPNAKDTKEVADTPTPGGKYS